MIGRAKTLFACVLLRKDGQVLGTTRRNNHDDWGLPGGKLEAGEEPRIGAARELFEETGIRVNPEDLQEVYWREAEGGGISVTYEAKVWQGVPTLQPGEGLTNWIPWEFLERGSFGEYNKRLHQVVS